MLSPVLIGALTGCPAPTLTLSSPPIPASGVQTVSVHVLGGTGAEVALFLDGVETDVITCDPGGEFTVDTETLSDGSHVVVLESRGWFRGKARVEQSWLVDNTAPELIMATSSLRVGQGRTLGVFARADERVSEAEVTFLDATWSLERLEDGLLRGVKGISVSQAPGPVPLSLRVVDDAGNETTASWKVLVEETKFPKGGFVQLSTRKKRDMGNEERSRQANELRWQAYIKDLGLPLVEGLFLWPVEGKVSSAFGKQRRYNTGVVRHHLGTDLRGSTGTPVVAAHDGVVTLAEELHIYGNAVILKHGPNVSTSYNHLAQIAVEEGQEVTRGMMVGRVGSTGQSTGPHLHWGMEVGGTAVAPEEWIERDFSQPLPGDFEPGVPAEPGGDLPTVP